MNANKAIEFGFADDILTDEKKKADDVPAYAFSGKDNETRLMNKIMTHFKPENKTKATPAQAAAIPAEKPAIETKPVEKKEETGTPIDELTKRLNLIRP